MKAYLIADLEVTDPDGYKEYQRGVPATLEAHGARYLVRGGAVEALEGDWAPRRCVILEFPSIERLKAWWDSAEYRPLKEVRRRTSRGSLVAVEGYAPPA